MIRELEDLHARGELEVESLIEIGLREETPIRELREFQVSHYPPTAPQHWWLEGVIRYREGGCSGLLSWVVSDREKFDFAVGLLEAIGSTSAVETLATLVDQGASDKEAERIASSINIIMSFEPAPSVSEDTLLKVRRFLHLRLTGEKVAQVATSMYALREVGDMTSLAILRRMSDLPTPYSRARRLAIARIRRRWS